MVNTFITSSDYAECAKNLDYRRLGKQRVEAYQILDMLEQLRYVGRHIGLPFDALETCDCTDIPANAKTIIRVFHLRCKWVDDVIAKYKSLSYIILEERLTAKKFKISKTDIKTKNLARTNKKFTEKYKIYLRSYINHPIIKMWCGHEHALKLYINACIKEWIHRGYKNTMTVYFKNDPVNTLMAQGGHPWWIYSANLHASHIISLLKKETERSEPLWHWNNMEFVDVSAVVPDNKFEEFGYIWPCNLTQEQNIELCRSTSVRSDIRKYMTIV